RGLDRPTDLPPVVVQHLVTIGMHVAAPTPEHRAIDLHDGVAHPVVVPVVLGCCLGQASAAERAHRVQLRPGGEVGGKVLSVTVGRDIAGSEAELHNTPSGPVIGTSPGRGRPVWSMAAAHLPTAAPTMVTAYRKNVRVSDQVVGSRPGECD